MKDQLLDFNGDDLGDLLPEPKPHNAWTCSICWHNRLIGILLGLALLGLFFGPALWVLLSGGAESK